MEKDNSQRKSLAERAQMSEIERLRHSCAHILANAILQIWPDTQFAGGPPVENGFYYDFDLDYIIKPSDFPKIEQEMKKIVKENQTFEKQILTRNEAAKLALSGRLAALGSRQNKSVFKLDLLSDIPKDEEISTYKNGDFIDLCAGPHVPRTGNCRAFKLMSVASAYYKGDNRNYQIQRIYGTAFKNKTQLNEYLEMLNRAKELDHRKLGKKHELFQIDEQVGQGLILWKPKGAIIRRQLQDFILEKLDENNYQQVFTPHIGKLELYRTSGHFPYYSDSQYSPIISRETLQKLADEQTCCSHLANNLQKGEIDGYLLKPMNCPHHIKIYQSELRSYRDLPIRLAEFGTVYRWEKSGELGGMTRVRGFTQDDAHIFCTEEQLENEIISCLKLVKTILQTLGLNNYRVRIGLKDEDTEKYVGEEKNWQAAEQILIKCVKKIGYDFSCEVGEAAFYGPKIDFVVKDVINRQWQLGTIQVDYNLPQRFKLKYIDKDNNEKIPIMIHRAPFGSLERFIGILIEHFAARFPLWLSPEQVRILTISEKFNKYAQKVFKKLKQEKIRVEIDLSSDKIGAKIRNAQLAQVPIMLIIGEKEEKNKNLSIRHRNHGNMSTMKINDFLSFLKKEISNKL